MYLEATGAILPNKTPGSAPDPIRMWQQVKQMLNQKLGIYRLQSGAPAVIKGKIYPRLSMKQAQALMAGLQAFADDISSQLQKAGRYNTKVSRASTKMLFAYNDWRDETRFKYGNQKFQGKYLFAAAVRDLFKIFDVFMIEVSTAQWSGYNIENSYERFMEALDETPGGSLLKWPVKAGMAAAAWVAKGMPMSSFPGVPDLTNLAKIIKWGSIGGGLFMLYWYALKPQKK